MTTSSPTPQMSQIAAQDLLRKDVFFILQQQDLQKCPVLECYRMVSTWIFTLLTKQSENAQVGNRTHILEIAIQCSNFSATRKIPNLEYLTPIYLYVCNRSTKWENLHVHTTLPRNIKLNKAHHRCTYKWIFNEFFN